MTPRQRLIIGVAVELRYTRRPATALTVAEVLDGRADLGRSFDKYQPDWNRFVKAIGRYLARTSRSPDTICR